MGRKRCVGKVVDVPKRWLSGAEACAYLDCSLDFLEKLRRDAEVSFSRYGRKIWYSVASLDSFVDRHVQFERENLL